MTTRYKPRVNKNHTELPVKTAVLLSRLELVLNDLMDRDIKILSLRQQLSEVLKEKTKLLLYIDKLQRK